MYVCTCIKCTPIDLFIIALGRTCHRAIIIITSTHLSSTAYHTPTCTTIMWSWIGRKLKLVKYSVTCKNGSKVNNLHLNTILNCRSVILFSYCVLSTIIHVMYYNTYIYTHIQVAKLTTGTSTSQQSSNGIASTRWQWQTWWSVTNVFKS